MKATVFDNARIVDPSRGIDEVGTVVVDKGRIAAAGASARNQGAPGGAEVVDCRACPHPRPDRSGVVESRAFTSRDDRPGKRAAAAGGVTSIVMRCPTPTVIDDVALVEFALRVARDTAAVNVHPAAAVTKGLAGQELTEFGLLRRSRRRRLHRGRHTIRSASRRALTYACDFGATIAHETQDADPPPAGHERGPHASWLGLAGIPREAELIPLERDLALARLTGGAYHAAKVSPPSRPGAAIAPR